MLGGVTVIAGIVAPEATGRPLTVPIAIAAMALPALALLGAGLAPTAVGSRVDAAVVGVALAIGAPVAAALSTAIAVFVVLAASEFDEVAGPAVGQVIKLGVASAARVTPLLVAVAVLWVIAIRYLERRAAATTAAELSPRGPADEASRPWTSMPPPRDEADETRRP